MPKPHPAYGWDLTKNICETYRTDARIDLAYTYTPYGEVSPAHTYDQPLRWSSEYHDVELGLVYYNYRHYNPAMGRWMGRDLDKSLSNINDFVFIKNLPEIYIDRMGLSFYSMIPELIGLFGDFVYGDKCPYADEITIRTIRQTCTRKCEYDGMWASCPNTSDWSDRQAKFICKDTPLGLKLIMLEWLDSNKPKPSPCLNKKCCKDRGVTCDH